MNILSSKKLGIPDSLYGIKELDPRAQVAYLSDLARVNRERALVELEVNTAQLVAGTLALEATIQTVQNIAKL